MEYSEEVYFWENKVLEFVGIKPGCYKLYAVKGSYPVHYGYSGSNLQQELLKKCTELKDEKISTFSFLNCSGNYAKERSENDILNKDKECQEIRDHYNNGDGFR